MASSLTARSFDGALSVDITEFQTNLVPYRASIALTRTRRSSRPSRRWHRRRDHELGLRAGRHDDQCDRHGKYDALPHVPGGVVKDVNASIADQDQAHDPFVDWPTGFKCGINYQPPPSSPAATSPASSSRLP